jgi:hypothetical protein
MLFSLRRFEYQIPQWLAEQPPKADSVLVEKAARGNQTMRLIIALLLLGLSACASDQPIEHTDEVGSGPTIYGQISGSVDNISTD